MLNLMIVHFFGLISPGPDFFYVVRMAVSNSRRNTISGIVGITLGVAMWATAAILGLAILFNTFPMLHGLMMLLGGGYLFYLGILMVKVKENVVFTNMTTQALNQNTTITKEVLKGFGVNLSNAKAVIYFTSVMALVLKDLTETWQILTALFIIIVETFLYFYGVSVFFSGSVAKRFYSRYSRYIDNISGMIFLFFGSFLIYSAILEIRLQ
ncbi:LysE family transporter [Conservatibacter flavescens]|uniref:Threonine efflux protein n=1 Tax=Conservatibacter flavescens TaxID=28161 RepID=A0A2M8S5S7_9PAST|nr:LysE family transporter [Conservatibacter flavescens]PJG86499.1 hypothetical protein CVP05_01455 [Conservatibacter flavescens]